MDQANAAEAMADESNEMTDEQKVEALVQAVPEEEFGDTNLQGAVNLREITNIELSLKTPIAPAAA